MRKLNVEGYSRYSSKGARFAQSLNRKLDMLLQKPVFEKRIANGTHEIGSATNENSEKKVQSSSKSTPTRTSLRKNEEIFFGNLKDGTEKNRNLK